MLEEYDFRKLNELSVGIQTDAIRIHVEWLHVVRSNSFYNPKWHTHPIAELHCVLEGTDVFYMGGNHALSVNSGLCLLIPPNAEHRRVSEPNDKLVKFSICLGSELLKGSDEAKFLDSFLHLSVFQLMPFPADAQALLIKCLQEANERKAGFLTNISCYLHCALIAIARKCAHYPDATYFFQTHKVIDDERYEIIQNYITEHIAEPISVQELANHIGLSTKQLGRIIASASDYSSASELITAMRIDCAKQYLSHPELNNSDIAQLVGFGSEYYFNRVFKARVGLPPGQYRKSKYRSN